MKAVTTNKTVEKYPAYKDSGVEWLGEIPEHWDTRRIKFLFRIGRGRVIAQTELREDGIYPVYSSQTQANGVLGYLNTYDFDCKQITWTTDGANAGTIFLREGKHSCTNVCGTLQPLSNQQVIEFITYSLQVAAQFYKRPDTNGAKIMNGEMAEIFVTLPSKEEQTAIARFLDDKTALIDKAIAIKEQQIELLKERRQILIHRAVTRGLNPNVKFKDSGVEWIGEIPEHWEVKRLKYISRIKYGLGQPPKEKENGLPLIRATNVERGVITEKDMVFVDPDDIPWERDPELKENDIIVVRSGAYTADSAIIPKKYEGAIAGYDMVVTPFKINAQFLAYALLSNYILYDQLYLLRMRAAQPHLNAEELGETLILVPNEEEQSNIVHFVFNLSEKIIGTINNKTKEIVKLKEYKASLINSAVTGKIKVC